MRRIFIFYFLLFAVTSCSMPETRIYSLYLPAEKSVIYKHTNISIAVSVKNPKYLSQPYIVHRDSPYSLEIAKYSKWHSSPGEIIKETLKSRLVSAGLFKEVVTANFPPSDYYSLRINLTDFERFDADSGPVGKLGFDVEFFSPDGRELYRSVISKEVKLEDKSFLSLAKGLSAALSEGLEETMSGIVKVLPKTE